MQIHLHKAFFSDDRFLDLYHKSFLNQTTLDLRNEKWSFLNREFTVPFVQIVKNKMLQNIDLSLIDSQQFCNRALTILCKSWIVPLVPLYIFEIMI